MVPNHATHHILFLSSLTHFSTMKCFLYCAKSVQIRSFFWSIFSYIWSEYRDLLSKSPYSVQIQENTDLKKLRISTLFTQWYPMETYGKFLFCDVEMQHCAKMNLTQAFGPSGSYFVRNCCILCEFCWFLIIKLFLKI